MTSKRTPLRLTAQDASDLQVIAATLQDAVGKIGDFRFDKARRRFTLALNRFRWEDGRKARGRRVRCAVDIGGVLGVRAHRLRLDAPEAVLSVLTIGFEAGGPPGGILNLTFAGGAEIRIDVECLDMLLVDISEPWPATRRPEHKDAL